MYTKSYVHTVYRTFNDFCYHATILINQLSNEILASSIFHDYYFAYDEDVDNAKYDY